MVAQNESDRDSVLSVVWLDPAELAELKKYALIVDYPSPSPKLFPDNPYLSTSHGHKAFTYAARM